jgi:hypothetical protein
VNFTTTMQQALDTLQTMRPEHQDLIAVEILERVRMLMPPATKLRAEERAKLEAELAAVFARHGL